MLWYGRCTSCDVICVLYGRFAKCRLCLAWCEMCIVVCLQLDPQEAQIAALKRELFLLRQENVWLRDQVLFSTMFTYHQVF